MDIFEAILDILDEKIYDKAFNKNNKLLKRLPYIIIYEVAILLLIVLACLMSLIFKNIISIILIIMTVLLITLLFLPFIKNK